MVYRPEKLRNAWRDAGTGQRITDLALCRSGVRDTARVLGISPQTVMRKPKKLAVVKSERKNKI